MQGRQSCNQNVMAGRYNLDEFFNANSKKKPCRACVDFKTWAKLQGKSEKESPQPTTKDMECPVDSESLGRNTWSFLHTTAAYYPDNPTETQQRNMTQFINLFAQFYPCDHCAAHMRQSLKSDQPDTSNSERLSQWMCRLHNQVNLRLGKPEFDCSRVLERWRDGWKDGSCD